MVLECFIAFQGGSNISEKRGGNSGNGNVLEEIENNAVRHASPMDNSDQEDPTLPRNMAKNMANMAITKAITGKFYMSRRQLEEFLSQFYLIRTAYGYMLGRT